MRHVAAIIVVCLIVVVAAHGARAQGSGDARNVVVITLLPQATLDDTVVYLDQIAKLRGGPTPLRQRLARLDVAEFKLGFDRTVVSSDHLRFRLMLAGIAATQFQLAGAKQTTINESDDPIAARRILAIADRTIRLKNPSVGAPKEIIVPLLDLHPSDTVRLDAKVSTKQFSGGGRVDVAIIVNGKTRDLVPVSFESARTEPAGRPGIMTEAAPAKGEVVVKNRDLVRIIAVIGAAHIVATGEAQQDGKVGEIIRVRNTESNRIVNGRIESRDVVTVEY